MPNLFTLGETAVLLGKERAWLRAYVSRHPTDENGVPYFTRLGSDLLFTSEAIQRLEASIQAYERRPVFLYFFEAVGQGAIKIGIAVDWHARLLNLRSASPFHLRRLLVLDFFVGLEKPMHRRFERLRIRGEWFRDGPQIRDFIASCHDHPLFVLGAET